MSIFQAIQCRDSEIPGQSQLRLRVYGPDKAIRPLQDGIQQGYFVSRDGKPVSRAELTVLERHAVTEYLAKNHPEHAKL